MPKLFRNKSLTLAKLLLIFPIIIASILLLSNQPLSQIKAAGTTYYVSKTSCSDSYPGIESQPWCTIQKAADTLGAGDTVYVKQGVYSEIVNASNSGSEANYITFKAYGNDNVEASGFVIYGDYVQVEGFKVTNDGINFEANNSRIINNIVTRKGIYTDEGKPHENNALIKGNTLTNSKITLYGNNHIVEYNDISESMDLIWLWGDGHIIRNNYMHDCNEPYPDGNHIDCFQTFENYHDDSIVLTNLVIENNFCYSIRGYNSHVFMAEGSGHGNWTIRNNVFGEIGASGLILHEIENVKVYNNTFMEMGMDYEPGWAKGVNLGFGATGGKIVNNIFYNIEGGAYWVSGDSKPGFEADYNLAYGSSMPSEDHSVRADPKFVDYANRDFHLQPDSPAIDAGLALNEVVNDFDGNPRPQGAGYDIGAYEYGRVVSSPSPTPTPSPSPSPSSSPSSTPPLSGDVNGDGYVNKDDVLDVLRNWLLSIPNPSEADVNGDNKVNSMDFAYVIKAWGQINTSIRLKAETGTLTSPMETGFDSNASGCSYVHTPNGGGNSSGFAAYTINIPTTGDYLVWGRAYGLDSEADSFYVSVDGGAESVWDIPVGSWQWDRVSNRGSGSPGSPETDPVIYPLSIGQHTFRFRTRDDGSRLDIIEITSDMGYAPAEVTSCTQSPPPSPSPSPSPPPSPSPGSCPISGTNACYNLGDGCLSKIGWVETNVLARSQQPSNWSCIKDLGIRAVVNLRKTGVDGYSAEQEANERNSVQALGMDYLHIPVKDDSSPTAKQLQDFLDFVDENKAEGSPVLVHCAGGSGRAGFMSAGWRLRETSCSMDEVIDEYDVCNAKMDCDNAYKYPGQYQCLHDYATALGKSTPQSACGTSCPYDFSCVPNHTCQ